uniref:mRNA (guanine-N(7))-methyltransferase n=1 Tax=viral metagenome TaxID=1070528 RepID=A0A6C0LUG4_9ZZZZ
MSKQNSDSMEGLISKYLAYNHSTSGFDKELEVRFNTRKYDGVIQKMDFDRVVQKLLSMGFKSGDLTGSYMMRVSSEYDSHNKMITEIRTEILGKDNIQQLCKTNRIPENGLVTFQKKGRVENKGGKLSPVNNAEFQFRTTFNIEENISSSHPLIKNQYLEKFESLKKYYRYINRVEFTHPDYPIKCHLSIVKSSKKDKDDEIIYERSIQHSDVFKNTEVYEIELEIDNAMVGPGTQYETTESISNPLKNVIKYVLCGLQNTKYPVSYKMLYAIEQQYKQFILQTHPDKMRSKLIPRQFIGPGSITLQRKHVQPIDPASKEPNIQKNYCVTEKADGERRLLYVSGNGMIFAITTNMNFICIGAKTKVSKLYHTMIDCEYIMKNKHGDVIDLYAAFDVYYIAKQDQRNLIFMNTSEPTKTRHGMLLKVISALKPESMITGQPSPVRIEAKQFYSSGNIFEDNNMIIQKTKDGLFEYETDGLVFTPTNLSLARDYVKKTWDKSFKWKPPEFNSIDFLVKMKNDGKTELVGDSIVSYKTLTLMCGFQENESGYLHPCADVMDDIKTEDIIGTNKERHDGRKPRVDSNATYKPHKFYPTKPYDSSAHLCNIASVNDADTEVVKTIENEVIEDNMIVEFYYDFSRPKLWRWVPLRVRYDKTRELRNGQKNYGNSYNVANSNWQSIHHPIDVDMMSSGIGIPDIEDDDTYYNRDNKRDYTVGMRDFHNKVVKRMLIESVSNVGDILIDFAVGKGGDFPKWIQSKLSFVFGIDKSPDNIENHVDGACARFLNYKKKLDVYPDALFVSGDSGLRITTLDAPDGEKYKNVTNAIFNKGSKDLAKIGKAALRHYGKAKDGFHVSSCQFALHYFFRDVTSLENFIQNIVDCTRVGGYFTCTSYNGKKMFDYLSKRNKGESEILKHTNGEKMWEVIKQYEYVDFKDDVSCIGYGIDVYQDTINKLFREYLVNYDYFFQILEKYGFKLLTQDEAREINLPSSFGSFEDLHRQMQIDLERGTIKSQQIGQSNNMNKQEQQISFFNSFFVCKKVRHETTPVKLLDSVIGEEDAIMMSDYMTSLEKEVVAVDEGENIEAKIMIEDPFEVESKLPTEAVESKPTKTKAPRKKRTIAVKEKKSDLEEGEILEADPVEKKKRGRPKKITIKESIVDEK